MIPSRLPAAYANKHEAKGKVRVSGMLEDGWKKVGYPPGQRSRRVSLTGPGGSEVKVKKVKHKQRMSRPTSTCVENVS